MPIDMKDLIEKINRARMFNRQPATRASMTDEQVKDNLRRAAVRIWEKNPRLQELAELADEIDQLEQVFTVLASKPVALHPLASDVRKEYESKVERFNELISSPGTEEDLASLNVIVEHIGKLIAR